MTTIIFTLKNRGAIHIHLILALKNCMHLEKIIDYNIAARNKVHLPKIPFKKEQFVKLSHYLQKNNVKKESIHIMEVIGD